MAATALANGENEVLKLTLADHAIFVQANEFLRPLHLPLNVAVSESVTAVTRSPDGTLREAVDFFLQRNPASVPKESVREVVDKLIDAKTNAGRGDVHFKDLASWLWRFADALQMNISQVTGPMIQQQLDSLNVTTRTKLNHLRHITSLFKFAERRNDLPKGALDELEAVEKPEPELTEIEIFTPTALRQIRAAARPEVVPGIAISAFAGLRSAELQRLDWADVNLAERHIEATAAKSKTASRRLEPITANLPAWLTPYAQPSGPVTGFAKTGKQLDRLSSDVDAAEQCQSHPNGCRCRKGILFHGRSVMTKPRPPFWAWVLLM